MVHAEPSHAPERRIGRVLKSQSLGRRRVMLIVIFSIAPLGLTPGRTLIEEDIHATIN